MGTTNTKRVGKGPDLKALVTDSGKAPKVVAAEARVSSTTLYMAMRGALPKPIVVAAIAGALGISEDECRAAILRARAA